MKNTGTDVTSQLLEGLSGKIAWDVGSHMGQAIPDLLKRFDQVEAFEPSTESFASLALDYVDHPWVRLHRLALADHDGTLDTSVREVAAERGQLVLPGPYEEYVPGAEEENLSWGKEIGTRIVLCRSMDSLVSTSMVIPDFVNVDTEGFEVQVLQGASDVLRFGKTSWLVEYHTELNYEQCVKILEAANYKVQVTRHPQHKPEGELWRAHGWIRATV